MTKNTLLILLGAATASLYWMGASLHKEYFFYAVVLSFAVVLVIILDTIDNWDK